MRIAAMARLLARRSLLVLIGLALVSIAWVALYRVIPPPGSLLMLIRLAEGVPTITVDRVPISRVSPALLEAIIAGEDTGFCQHHGVDWESVQAAFSNNQRGKSLRGASTISMQVAKNAFLWPDRSWLRKGAELWFTLWMEALWPKRRILETYVNLAEWGPGIFGAEAAAQHWFGKPAARLTVAEAARLAAILPNPTRWDPQSPGPGLRRRIAVIARRADIVRRDGLSACVRTP